MLPIILFLTIAFPVAWFLSEFQDQKWLRIVLGCGAIAMSFLVAAGVGMLQQLNYNTWYGDASQQLIETTLAELKADNKTCVIDNLTWLNGSFHPSYENRENYDELISAYVNRFKQSGK